MQKFSYLSDALAGSLSYWSLITPAELTFIQNFNRWSTHTEKQERYYSSLLHRVNKVHEILNNALAIAQPVTATPLARCPEIQVFTPEYEPRERRITRPVKQEDDFLAVLESFHYYDFDRKPTPATNGKEEKRD